MKNTFQKIFKNFQKISKKFSKKFSKIFKNFQKFSKIFKNFQKKFSKEFSKMKIFQKSKIYVMCYYTQLKINTQIYYSIIRASKIFFNFTI